MEPTTQSPLASAAPERPEDKIRHLPDEVQAAFRRFQQQGDLAALDPVILAILVDFAPRKPEKPLSEHAGDTLLVEDLGLDSLAITEVVFFTEDLFGITIANEEIIQVRTLDDLRGFVRSKVAARG